MKIKLIILAFILAVGVTSCKKEQTQSKVKSSQTNATNDLSGPPGPIGGQGGGDPVGPGVGITTEFLWGNGLLGELNNPGVGGPYFDANGVLHIPFRFFSNVVYNSPTNGPTVSISYVRPVNCDDTRPLSEQFAEMPTPPEIPYTMNFSNNVPTSKILGYNADGTPIIETQPGWSGSYDIDLHNLGHNCYIVRVIVDGVAYYFKLYY